jgi:type IV secretory pathway VirD2 relaxase
VGFDGRNEEIELSRRVDRWQGEGDARLWKVVVSPEQGREMDLRAHARQFVDRVERDLGRRLEWAAIEHYDTDHPHVHVLIRGVDRNGQTLRFPREYVRSGFRMVSRELATLELGLRRERERTRTPTRSAPDRLVKAQIQLERERWSRQVAQSRTRWERAAELREKGRGPDRERTRERER